jgi:hypothetical protein
MFMAGEQYFAIVVRYHCGNVSVAPSHQHPTRQPVAQLYSLRRRSGWRQRCAVGVEVKVKIEGVRSGASLSPQQGGPSHLNAKAHPVARAGFRFHQPRSWQTGQHERVA